MKDKNMKQTLEDIIKYTITAHNVAAQNKNTEVTKALGGVLEYFNELNNSPDAIVIHFDESLNALDKARFDAVAFNSVMRDNNL